MLYEYVGNVLVGAKPQDEGHQPPPTTGWIVRGKLTLQRQSELALAAAVSCLGSVNVPGMFSFRKCFGLSPATRTMINSIPLGIIFLFILKKTRLPCDHHTLCTPDSDNCALSHKSIENLWKIKSIYWFHYQFIRSHRGILQPHSLPFAATSAQPPQTKKNSQMN